jgi:chromosome segregation ATPase
MVEPVMFLAIGFLAASLLAIVFIPLVHNRAVRITLRRLEASTPLSMAEIQADKDQLRAEFAMSTRRLEMSVEQLKAKTTSQLAELGKKSDTINRMKIELGEKAATIFALEARERALKDQLRATEEEYAVRSSMLREAERALADKEAELAKLSAALNEQAVVADSQRIELVALRTQIEALRSRIAEYEKEVKETEERLDRERVDAAAASRELNEQRSKVEHLGGRVGELERQLAAQTAEAETLGKRANQLEERLVLLTRQLADREHECDQLRREIETARKVETDLRAELVAADGRLNEATQALRTEKEQLAHELAQAQEERARLQNELAAIKRDAESTWAAERVENALLRERINDVAAEVARLAVVLEGPDSPIEAILADSSHAGANGGPGNGRPAESGDLDGDAKGDLTARMRALKTRASRFSSST